MTGTTTRFTGTRILAWPSTCGGGCGSCWGADSAGAGLGGACCAAKWAPRIAGRSIAAIKMVLRRLFMVVRPNFHRVGPLEWLPPHIHRDASLHLKGRKHPSGNLRPGISGLGKYTWVP